jgi:AraC-like DNA-binding protein
MSLPGTTAFKIDTLAVGQRTPGLIADGADLVGLSIVTRNSCFGAQGGNEHVIEAGAAMLLSWTEKMTLRSVAGESNTSIGILMPRSAIQAMAPGIEDSFGRVIPAGNEALKLLIHYFETLQRVPAVSKPETALAVTNHMRDLIALAAGASRDAAMIAAGRGLRAGRMNAIRLFIAGNLNRHDLSVGMVARAHHLTERYVQRLFESEGTTFSHYLLERRLRAAHRMLVDPSHGGHISAIAYECGFGEVSYFNRVFRRRFGGTPSDVRAQGVGQSTGLVTLQD